MRSDWAAAGASKSDLKATQSKLKLFTQSVASKPQRALCSLPRKKNSRERKNMAKRTTLLPEKRKKKCGHQSANVSYGQAQTLLAPNPSWLLSPCPTPGQTFCDYVGQFWCPDCDWSAFNAILLNGSVKMVRFERWHAQISAQRLYAWSTKVGGAVYGSRLVGYAREVVMRYTCSTYLWSC